MDTNKIYSGLILDIVDEINPSKYPVHIPEIHNPLGLLTKRDYVWVYDDFGSRFFGIKDSKGTYSEIGSRFPLPIDLSVQIKFKTTSIESGVIIGVSDEHKIIPSDIGTPSNYHLIAGTKNRSKIYIDDDKNRLHLSVNNGKSDILMDDSSIILQLNDVTTSVTKILSKFELSESGISIKFGDKQFKFNDTGFVVSFGEGKTFFKMTDKGFDLSGEEFGNISTGNLNIYGESTYLTSEGSLNLRGTNTKVTGLQKLAMNGTIVNLHGWMDTHIKGDMNLSLKTNLFMNTEALMSDQQYQGISNIYATLENKVSNLLCETSQFKAEAIETIASDGMLMKGLGIATGTSQSVSNSSNLTMQGLKASSALLTSTFNLDNIGTSVSSSIMADSIIVDTAEPATEINNNLFGSSIKVNIKNETDTNFITKLNDYSRIQWFNNGNMFPVNNLLQNI